MADAVATEGEPVDPVEPVVDERRRGRLSHALVRVLKWIGAIVLILIALVAIATAFLHTKPGREYIVEQISKVAPASGLSVEVGRIEGSIMWSSTLYDVKFRDANDTLFLEVPEIELNWRPYKFLFSGLDVRHLVLHDGTLYAAPELIPGDPDAPLLPDFDMRVDRFVIDDLRVSEGLMGEERIVDFRAKADIRDGHVLLDLEGEFGGGDAFAALINAEPDGDRFDLDVDYRAPQGGFLAALVGAEEDLRVRVAGDGGWSRWEGAMVAVQGGENLAAFKLYNRSGRYRLVGQARPGDYVTGMPAQLLGEVVSLAAVGTLEDSVLRGAVAMRAAGANVDTVGTIDLADNAFEGFEVRATLLDEELFGEGMTLSGARVVATLDGPFRELSVPHVIQVAEINAGGTILQGIEQQGTLSYDGTRYVLPLNVQVERIVSGNAMVDPRLTNGRIGGTLYYTGDRLLSDDLAVRFPGLAADLALRADLARGAYGLAGPVRAEGLTIENLGTIDGRANIQFRMGSGLPWQMQADFSGRMPRVTNATLANLAGGNIRFSGGVTLGSGAPIAFRNTRLQASKLSLVLDGRVEEGRTTVAGSGRHVDYGPFTVEAEMAADGPRAVLVFADPLPAAGLRNVRVALAPTADGFRIETEGQSMLGPFDGLLNLYAPANGPVRISIERLDVWRTSVSGNLVLRDSAVEGTLSLTGGGLDGTIGLAPRSGGQGFDVSLVANQASFAGPTPLVINQGRIEASGFIGGGRSTVTGNVRAAGVSYGSLFIGRLAAQAQIVDGSGRFDASLSGRRGSRFELQLTGDVAPSRIAVAARGSYAGRRINMPRRAVLLKTSDGGWQLQKTQLSFGGGFIIAEGRFGGREQAQGRISLAQMPLSLIDVFAGDIGLGGTASGVIDVTTGRGGLPTGEARVMIDDLTRTGLVLTSRPIDLALVARLSATQLQARAVLQEEGSTKGRLQALISGLPARGSLPERLYAGDLFAQLRFEGPADSLWRLSGIELLDVTGTLQVAANVRGSLGNPQVQGSLAGDSLRVQSALIGADIRNVRARGRFSGSRLQLTSFTGTTGREGRVSGSGFVDLSNMDATRGPQIDLRLAAREAELIDMSNMGATVTGPLRIVSSGVGGTIAGRLRVNDARWQLGIAAAAEQLPNIRTREINLPPDIAPPIALAAPWRYLIDATAPSGIEVDGMGLDSEWRGDILLRGTTDNPRIGGRVEIVPRQSSYSFAGVRFELTRGEINFDENAPIDPRLNILAEAEVEALTVIVAIAGTATEPEISFRSVPALPEEEILAQLLFGGSISNLSATDALQLGAALASLRGGGGMDPINRLRTAIGLDRLRIVPADPALDRGTAIALGKNFGRRFYVEIITDGRGYNATSGEFRVTSWLSLLASINTLGRGTVAAEYRRDY